MRNQNAAQAVGTGAIDHSRARVSADTSKDLWWYFNDADADRLISFALFALPSWRLSALERDDGEIFAQSTRRRRIRAALESISEMHANVLAWAFTRRVYPPMLLSAVVEYPGVAVRTHAARYALASAERELRVDPDRIVVDPDGVTSYGSPFEVVTGNYRTLSPSALLRRSEVDGSIRYSKETGPEKMGGMLAFLSELGHRSATLETVRSEARKRIEAASTAYEAARCG